MTVKNKVGRKPIEDAAMTNARRQQRGRALNELRLDNGDLADISTSGLISLLPKLFAGGAKEKLKLVIGELFNRI